MPKLTVLAGRVLQLGCIGMLWGCLLPIAVAASQETLERPVTVAQATTSQRLAAPRSTVPKSTAPGRAGSAPQPIGPAAPAVKPREANDDFAMSGATRSLGGASAQQSSAPYMVGDFFTSGGQISKSGSANDNIFFVLAEVPNAGGSRRVKISENSSPFPRDRVFYSYNGFNNAIADFQNDLILDVQRHTPGFEKSFLDGLASFELRTPVAYTQNSDIFLGGGGPSKATEFGNISVSLKTLLWSDDDLAIAAGLGVNLPTADDVRLFSNGARVLTIHNESVHLLPYLGAVWSPSERLFVQGFLQLDIDANGNAVSDDQAQHAAVLNEQTLMYVDLSIGYWLFRDDQARRLTGIIPLFEFHYTTTLQDSDLAEVNTQNQGLLTLGNVSNRLDITNVTAGAHFRIGQLSLLTVAGCFPLQSGDERRQFDSELILQFNRFF